MANLFRRNLNRLAKGCEMVDSKQAARDARVQKAERAEPMSFDEKLAAGNFAVRFRFGIPAYI